jgi:hypothetical protein
MGSTIFNSISLCISKRTQQGKKIEGIKTLVYFEDINIKNLKIIKEDYEDDVYLNQFYIEIPVKENRKPYEYLFQYNRFIEGPALFNYVEVFFQTEEDAKNALTKLKDAILDAALDLDAVIERPKLTERFFYLEAYPNGISDKDYDNIGSSKSAESDTNKEIQTNTSSNNNNQNNNTPNAIVKTEAIIELRNRSKASVDIIVKAPTGSSKNNFSIPASGSKKERIKVGSTISVNGNVVLTITADMDGESKIIAQ